MIGAIIQAHMGSTRLPGKVMLPISGQPILWHDVIRTSASKRIERVIVATSDEPADDVIEQFCIREGFDCFRGSDNDVVSRYLEAAKKFKVDTIVRITSDCPLIDPDIIDETVNAFEASDYDYISTVFPEPRTFPRGLDVEVFSFSALELAHKEAKDDFERSHGIWEREGLFKLGPTVTAHPEYARPYRLTVDYPEDYALIVHLYALFYKKGGIVSVPQVLQYLDQHPEEVAINAHCVQKIY